MTHPDEPLLRMTMWLPFWRATSKPNFRSAFTASPGPKCRGALGTERQPRRSSRSDCRNSPVEIPPGRARVASCRLLIASGIVSPWVVVPVSGFRATKPPSSAGMRTAVRSMEIECLRRRKQSSRDNLQTVALALNRSVGAAKEAAHFASSCGLCVLALWQESVPLCE